VVGRLSSQACSWGARSWLALASVASGRGRERAFDIGPNPSAESWTRDSARETIPLAARQFAGIERVGTDEIAFVILLHGVGDPAYDPGGAQQGALVVMQVHLAGQHLGREHEIRQGARGLQDGRGGRVEPFDVGIVAGDLT
jgi:hypothetical protein